MSHNAEKRWYVRDYVAGQPRQVWLFDAQTATRMGVTNPESGPGSFFRAEPGESIWDSIRRQTPWLNPDITEGHFHPMTLGPGEYYPRIARPLALAREPRLWSPPVEAEKPYVAGAKSQLTLLARRLETICQTVQPSDKTLNVYGHEIRNLVILAATEVEMHWRGILTANGSKARQFTTKDYVKLVEALKLADFAIIFHDFPDLQPIRPFAGWSKADPTKSLQWYDAYHGVKHNREGEFERGTLRHAFEAVSACIVLLVAQFGPTALNAELSSLVGLTTPNWPISEMYLSRLTSTGWSPINHPNL
ncbi:MAG: hypothetical protein WAK63_01785 [Xanthobacteraceae bacterium]